MKVSEVIERLNYMKESYGDLDVTIRLHGKKSEQVPKDEDEFIHSSDELFFSYDQFEERPDGISIQSFPY